jgi:hypothetical protein
MRQLETLVLEVAGGEGSKDVRERLTGPLAGLTEKLPHLRLAAFHDYWVGWTRNDRTAAEWVFRLGGTVKVRDEERVDPASAQMSVSVLDLPQEFRLTGISVRDCAEVNDTELAELEVMAGSPFLETLGLSGTPISNASLDLLKTFTLLKTLDVRRTKLTAGAIDELRSALPRCQIQWDDQP